MADRPDTTPSDDGQAARLARRELQRRRTRRERLGAVVALVAVVAAIVGLVALALSSGPSHEIVGARPKRARTGRHKVSAGPSDLVRNAKPQAGWEPYTGPVPILEYHVLGAAPAAAPYPE